MVGFCARNDHLADLYRPTYRQQEVVDSFFESFVAKGIAHIRRGRRQDNDRVKRLRLSDKQKRYLADQVSAIGALSRDRGVPVLFVLLDIRPIRSPYLEAVLGANGLYFVNATLPFEGRRFRDYMQHPLDSHPNAAANAVFADVLYDYLISASLLERSGPGPV